MPSRVPATQSATWPAPVHPRGHPASPNIVSKAAASPLWIAIEEGDLAAMARLLVDSGAHTMPGGVSLVSVAARRCDVAIVRLLLAAGGGPLEPGEYCAEVELERR